MPSHNESLPTNRLVTVVAIVPLASWIIYLPKMVAVSYSRGRPGTGGSGPQTARLSC
jgi:hypothetical protein